VDAKSGNPPPDTPSALNKPFSIAAKENP